MLIIGDFTAKVGDPSGRPKLRPRLTDEEIGANAATYVDQAAKVLDMEGGELVRNGDWLSPLRMDEVLRLTATVTVARMLERDDFSRRYLRQRAHFHARVRCTRSCRATTASRSAPTWNWGGPTRSSTS